MIVSTDTTERWDAAYEVCKKVAEETGVDICELPPLYETIDPDALNALLRHSNVTDTHSERSVEFSYCDYRVTAHSTGQVGLHSEPESTSSVPST
ncbi:MULTISPECIES: HalOD1 output domain-containing protein [Haloarcula]|uniref:HalOD1 output domain-containing protein n=1 Tax=Haloarcula TaxID=2237 RepID=UPI0023ED7C1B|nr:HalOD1 output domain-containing protein [Halomicroarcula sp. XH51]